MAKKGAEFERLTQWIASALYKHGVVEANAHLPHRGGPETREVDIAVRLDDGLSQMLVIGEVRDRGEPQDVQWIEQLASKIGSVSANGAFAVSTSGFTPLAARTARDAGIRLFTYAEAMESDWRSAFELCHVTVVDPGTAINIRLIDHASGECFEPTDQSLDALRFAPTSPYSAKLAESLSPLVPIAKRANELVAARVRERGHPLTGTPERFDERMELDAPLRFDGLDGRVHVVAEVLVEITAALCERNIPLVLWRLRDESTGDPRATVLECVVELPRGLHRVRLLIEGGGPVIPAGSRISVQCTPVDAAATASFSGVAGAFEYSGGSDAAAPGNLSVRLSLLPTE